MEQHDLSNSIKGDSLYWVYTFSVAAIPCEDQKLMQGVTILATHQYPSRLTEKATNGRGTKFDSKSFLFVSVVDVTTFGCSASSGPIADHNTGFARPDSTTTQ